MQFQHIVILNLIGEVIATDDSIETGLDTLWNRVWEARGNLGAIVYSRLASGVAIPSEADLTMFASYEGLLDKRLRWGLMSMDQISWYHWYGPDTENYRLIHIDEPANQLGWQSQLYERTYW